jgi:hypothetical protein
MLTRKKYAKKTLSVGRIKRKQKRKPRRLLESAAVDWERWDAEAQRQGLNFSEYARRALNNYTFLLGMQREGLVATIREGK